MNPVDETLANFIEAACVPLDGAHASGTLERADEILSANPDIASSSIFAAAALGDDASVSRWLELDPANAAIQGGPRQWDALTHLCFSRYLRLDPSRSDGFVRAATALLDNDANANTGWFEVNHLPSPTFESALYGAAGLARHAALTRLLLDRGADPNDDETPYHAPEGYDNAALMALVESGKMTADSLATMLLRKVDWHDADGIAWLLERQVDPNVMGRWGRTALHQAILRQSSLAIIDNLLDRGADPSLAWNGRSATALAARFGRGDVLDSFAQRALMLELHGVDELLAACAMNDPESAFRLADKTPVLVSQLRAEAGHILAEFAGIGNAEGLRLLLDLGLDPQASCPAGDGYWGLAAGSTPLHVAAWRGRPACVKLLIDRGAAVNQIDGQGRTPLQLAVKACVDSFWTARRTPEAADLLLRAGASVVGIPLPSGYSEVDELLRSHGA